MDKNQCSTTQGGCGGSGMLKCIVPVLVVFAVIFGFQWLYHGQFMMPRYEATAAMWRAKEEMEQFFWVCIVTKLVMAGVITCLYCCCSKGSPCCGKCPKTGLKFGLKIGLLMGALNFSSYAWLPFPNMEIPLLWLVGDVIQGALIGVVLAHLARWCKKDNGTCATK